MAEEESAQDLRVGGIPFAQEKSPAMRQYTPENCAGLYCAGPAGSYEPIEYSREDVTAFSSQTMKKRSSRTVMAQKAGTAASIATI